MLRVISRALVSAGAVLTLLLGAACTPLVPRVAPEVFITQAVKPPSAVLFSTEELILSPAVLAAALESAYLKKITDGFIDLCQGKAVGCAISAVGPNGMSVDRAAGDARRAPDDAPRKLTATDKITMASVSKTFTGTALQKLLYDKGICLDTAIGPYLPNHWKRSAAMDAVTFRQLLTHTSGLTCQGISYDQLKTCVSTASPCPSPQHYRNENFALMRILIPQIDGMVKLKALIDADLAGNSGPLATAYANYYIESVNETVFAPAGLPQMFCKPTDASPALSYKSATVDKWDFTQVGPGDPWGDMSNWCGSQGWFLSAHQMAQAMRAIMTPDKVLTKDSLDEMKLGNLAVYFADFGDGLQAWNHGGYHPAEMNMGEINTLIIHFNNGVSVGVVINSPYGANGQGGDFYGDLIAAVKAAG